MGLLVGLLAGLGLFLVITAGGAPARRPGPVAAYRARSRELLVQAGLPAAGPGQLAAVQAAAGLTAGLAVLTLSGVWALAVALASFATAAPRLVVRRRGRARAAQLRALWPDVVDNLASAVRAGLSLPEALAAIGVRGPAPLRPAFLRFAADYRATGAFGPCLDRLADDVADPVPDRIVVSLRLARDVGGTDLGKLLRTLSAFLREDARTRGELETRQGWQVNAARLAVAAPWAVLLLLGARGTALDAYDRPGGVLVLAVGGVASVLAYVSMRRIARLPEPRRGPR